LSFKLACWLLVLRIFILQLASCLPVRSLAFALEEQRYSSCVYFFRSLEGRSCPGFLFAWPFLSFVRSAFFALAFGLFRLALFRRAFCSTAARVRAIGERAKRATSGPKGPQPPQAAMERAKRADRGPKGPPGPEARQRVAQRPERRSRAACERSEQCTRRLQVFAVNGRRLRRNKNPICPALPVLARRRRIPAPEAGVLGRLGTLDAQTAACPQECWAASMDASQIPNVGRDAEAGGRARLLRAAARSKDATAGRTEPRARTQGPRRPLTQLAQRHGCLCTKLGLGPADAAELLYSTVCRFCRAEAQGR
jgi:hypothetical protein